jgi:hypothetical protein
MLLLLLGACATAPAPVEPGEPDRPSLPADVTPAQWNEALKPILPQLNDCRHRQEKPAGRIEVQLDIGPDGTPGSIVTYGGAVGAEMRECVVSSFVGVHFPKSARGGYRYRYPIVFR